MVPSLKVARHESHSVTLERTRSRRLSQPHQSPFTYIHTYIHRNHSFTLHHHPISIYSILRILDGGTVPRPITPLLTLLPRTIHRAAGHGASNFSQMPRQAFLAVLVLGVALADLLQAVAHEELVVARSEDGGRDVDEDTDPRVGREGALAEEDGGDDAGAQVPGEIGGDGVAGEAPDHDGVGDADGEGDGDGGDEWIRRVEAGPDDDADEAVDEELLEEEEALIGLVGVGEGAEDAGDAAVEGRRAVGLEVERFGGLDLRPVAAHQQQARDEGAEDLAEDVVRDLAPREALPDREAERHRRVEVATGDGGARDDSEGDADRERPADLENGAEDGDAEFFAGGGGGGEGEGGDGGDAGEAAEWVYQWAVYGYVLVGGSGALGALLGQEWLLRLTRRRKHQSLQPCILAECGAVCAQSSAFAGRLAWEGLHVGTDASGEHRCNRSQCPQCADAPCGLLQPTS